jgi:hypothetical protein
MNGRESFWYRASSGSETKALEESDWGRSGRLRSRFKPFNTFKPLKARAQKIFAIPKLLLSKS